MQQSRNFRSSQKFSRSLLSALAIATLLLAGCDDSSLKQLDAFVGGTFDGFLLTFQGESSHQNFVTATLLRPAPNQLSITGQFRSTAGLDVARARQGASGVSDFQFYFQLSGTGAAMTSSLVPGQTFQLNNAKNQCFWTTDTVNWARLCFDKVSEVTIDVNSTATGRKFTLVIDPKRNAHLPTMEAPRDYTLNQIVDHAIHQAFSSRVEFEKVTQSKLGAENAALNLLPHVGINTITSVFSLSLTSMIKAIGDVMPFLFPAKWTHEKEMRYAYDAEFNAWITMKADAGSIAEGLGETILEVQHSLRVLQVNKDEITLLRDQIREREKTGVVQIGTSDDISSVINSIDLNLTSLQLLTMETTASLAESAGFYNPRAVRNLLPSPRDSSVASPKAVNEGAISTQALERAYELRQLDDLVQVARTATTQRYFNWLDPNGDDNGNLGAGLPSYIEIGYSQIRELVDRRQQTQSQLLNKTNQEANNVKEAIIQWKFARQGQLISNNRIARIKTNIRLGINFEIANLVSALQEKVQNDLQLVQAEFNYQVAWARLSRLMYAGPYASLARGNNLSGTFESETGSAPVGSGTP